MIMQVQESQLAQCLEVIHASFAAVAEEFGITQSNCPTNGAFIPLSRLQEDFQNGNLMYGKTVDSKIVGFVQIGNTGNSVWKLYKLAVLPEYRHCGYGKELVEFAVNTIKKNNGIKVLIGIIEENTVLKNWYLKNGFTHQGTEVIPQLPFTVGFMERIV